MLPTVAVARCAGRKPLHVSAALGDIISADAAAYSQLLRVGLVGPACGEDRTLLLSPAITFTLLATSPATSSAIIRMADGVLAWSVKTMSPVVSAGTYR